MVGGVAWAYWSEVVRNYAIVAGGAAGLWLAWRRGQSLSLQASAAQNQAKIADRGHASALFHDAVKNLNDDKLETRLGSIYTLEQLERDYLEFSNPVLMVLSAYVRESAVPEERDITDVEKSEIIRLFGTKMTRGAAR